MKAISQFVVRVFDLIEAEGRTLLAVVRDEAVRVHGAVVNLMLATAFLVMAVIFVLVGCGLIAFGMIRWLEPWVSLPVALVLTGVAGASLGCVSLYVCRRVASGSDM
jgi:hypothetical protein